MFACQIYFLNLFPSWINYDAMVTFIIHSINFQNQKITQYMYGNTYYLWCLIICDYLNSDYLWLLEHMYKSKFGLSVTYLKSMVTDNPKTQKRIMGKNNSKASLSDVDYNQISLRRLEDQKYEICCFFAWI